MPKVIPSLEQLYLQMAEADVEDDRDDGSNEAKWTAAYDILVEHYPPDVVKIMKLFLDYEHELQGSSEHSWSEIAPILNKMVLEHWKNG